MLDTHPYRLAIVTYLREHNLPLEKGMETAPHGLLGKPARAALLRVGNNMVARGVLAAKYNDGTLNTHMQHALIPPLSFGDKVVKWALGEVGVHENPWGSNSGARVRWYQSFTGAYGSPWCASFVSAGLRENGYTGPVSALAWDWDHIGTRVDLKHAQPGDVVPFNIGDGHVGYYLDHSSSEVKTVDGNTSDQVAIRTRPLSVIRAITRHHA